MRYKHTHILVDTIKYTQTAREKGQMICWPGEWDGSSF